MPEKASSCCRPGPGSTLSAAASQSSTRAPAAPAAIIATTGQIGFRKPLLVRTEDAERIARHRDLSGADLVGAQGRRERRVFSS